MSTGICITSRPETDISVYLQHLAADFENVNSLLQKDDCDLSDYLYCPESYISEEELKECRDPSEDLTEELAYIKKITTENFFPIKEISAKIKQAIPLVAGYPEQTFEHGKEQFIHDLNELDQELSKAIREDVELSLSRG